MHDIYHILNKSIDNKKIFLDRQDYFRFIHDLFEFNDQQPANTASYRFSQIGKSNDLEGRQIRKPRKSLADIHAFCLMSNHYHLLLSPRTGNGIPWFMQKLGGGYVKYFNQKYNRKGTLFEGRYKSILVSEESHFYHLPYYIHFNPLDLKFPEWREGKLKNYKQALEFLENYRWSSHLDYLDKKNFPSVTNRRFLLKVFAEGKGYEQSIRRWLKELKLENIKKVTLE